jgi:hypothetical protein
MSGFGSLKPWEGGAQAELKKKAARLAGVGWRSLAAIDAGLEASAVNDRKGKGVRRKAISGASNPTISLQLCVGDFRMREYLRLNSMT